MDFHKSRLNHQTGPQSNENYEANQYGTTLELTSISTTHSCKLSSVYLSTRMNSNWLLILAECKPVIVLGKKQQKSVKDISYMDIACMTNMTQSLWAEIKKQDHLSF